MVGMNRAYVFDLDGTLLDTEILWVNATSCLLREWGLPLHDSEVLAIVYGHAWPDVYETLRRRLPALPMTRERMERAMSARLNVLRRDTDVRIAGSIALLERLAEQSPVCIVSGSPRADVDLGVRIMGLAGKIRFHLGAEDYAPGKPHPAGFLLAAGRLGVLPRDCVVFEDSSAGVAAAKAAGMRCVALRREGRPRQDVDGADLVLPDLAGFEPSMLPGESGLVNPA